MGSDMAGPGDNQSELLATQREEALALFSANQAARSAAERAFAAFLAVGGAALAAGVSADTDAVVIPVPAVLLLLLSHMFQQYSDLTVLGMGRLALEQRVNRTIGGKGLIYESVLADIRKQAPLVHSVRLLQAVVPLVTVVVIGAGTVAAADEGGLVVLAFVAGTSLAAASAAYSYAQMLQTPRLAREHIEASLRPPDPS